MTIPGERLDAVVAEAVAGDRDALREVLETIRPIVVRYCRARVGTAERSGLSADDVAQEVCLAAMMALPRYRDQGRPFLAFVYGIAAHKVADAHRAAGRNRAEPTDVVPERSRCRSRSRTDGDQRRFGRPDGRAAAGAAREAARDPDPARGRRTVRRGDRRSRRQHRRCGPGRAAPCAGQAEDPRSRRRGTTVPDFGRTPDSTTIARRHRAAATASSTRWHGRVAPPATPTKQALLTLLEGWRDGVRRPPRPTRGHRTGGRRRAAHGRGCVNAARNRSRAAGAG